MALTMGDIVRVSARFKNTVSGDVVNVFHWYAAGNITDSDATIIAAINTKLDDMFGNLSSHLVDDQDPYDLRMDVVDWIAGKEKVVRVLGSQSWVLTNPPANSQDALPQMDSLIVNARTAEPKSWGRKYLGVFSEGNMADGSATSTVLTAVASFISEWLTDITLTGGDLQAGILTYKTAPSGYHFYVFVSAIANAILGTQRRRRINRGS